jgi:opacity protein-like surface antigen
VTKPFNFLAFFKRASLVAAFSALAILQPMAGANAAVVQSDWQNAGDGLTTRDIANGREWLDLTQTTGLTVAEAVAQTGLGGRLESWRLANMDELFGFYGSAVGLVNPAFNGNTSVVDFSPSELAGLTTFVDLIGVTLPLTFRNDAIGLIGHSAAFSNEPNQAVGYFFYQTNGSGGYSWFNEGYAGASYSDASTGVFMVRNLAAAAVPEPASWALMICGMGLVGSALRRRRAHMVPVTG